MKTEYRIINGKRVKVNVYEYEEIKPLFSDGWKRTFENEDFLKKVGLTAPPSTFLVAASGNSIPTKDGKIAGICVLRTDEKDRPKGFPVNWNHWDFRLNEENKNEVIMIPVEQKRPDHWFRNEEEWKNRIKIKPPHEDIIIDEEKE